MADFGFQMTAPVPPKRKVWPVAIGAVVILVAATLAIFNRFAPAPDFEGTGDVEVTVTIESGDTLTRIGQRLVDAGVVASVDAWIAVVSGSADASTIGPGDYALLTQMSARSALDALLDPQSRAVMRLVVREGDQVTEIVKAAAKLTGIAKDEFYAALRKPALIGLPEAAGGKPEGFLFPATYEIEESDTAVDILKQMTARWKQASDDLELGRRAAAVGKSVREILTIASIVEVEAGPEDYSKVARVIENRLAIPMRLQLDSTVNYALGISQLQLSADQLDTESEFNTYKVDGLPPTPIGNPGELAIEAALEPTPGPWIYFVTVEPKTKLTKFAVTYEEFLILKAEFEANVS